MSSRQAMCTLILTETRILRTANRPDKLPPECTGTMCWGGVKDAGSVVVALAASCRDMGNSCVRYACCLAVVVIASQT